VGKVRSFRDTWEYLYTASMETAQGQVSNRKWRRCNPVLTVPRRFPAQHAAILQFLHPADKDFVTTSCPGPRFRVQLRSHPDR